MTGKIELTLLGQAEVRLAGEPLTGFYSGKAQALPQLLEVSKTPGQIILTRTEFGLECIQLIS
jgi:hypothetical protein